MQCCPNTLICIKTNFFLHLVRNISEAVAQRCSIKKVLLKISQNSQENTCARVSFSPVAASDISTFLMPNLKNFLSLEDNKDRSSHLYMFFKQVFLKISQISQEDTCVGVSFQQSLLQILLKRHSDTGAFPCEICEIFKNTFFYRTPPLAASVKNIYEINQH